MLTLAQMFKRTDGGRKDRARYVQILKMKTGHNQGLGFVAAQTFSRRKVNSKGQLVTNPNPTKYVTVITFLDRHLHCKVSCSCGDNTFTWETANSYKDAADIEYSNGDAPDIRNPGYKYGLCKHLIAVYLKIKDRLPK